MSDKNIGEAIMDSVGAGVSRMLDESMNELAVANTTPGGVKLESYGPPKVKNETIRIPVVVATVMEMIGDDANYQKVDQAFLDKNANLILQKLVLKLNPSSDDYGMGRRRGGMIFFDPDNFKMEFIEGGVVKLTTTLVCDLRPIISEMRGLRYKMENCLYDIAQKANKK